MQPHSQVTVPANYHVGTPFPPGIAVSNLGHLPCSLFLNLIFVFSEIATPEFSMF